MVRVPVLEGIAQWLQQPEDSYDSNGGPMHIERFFVPGLAHASYAIASGGEAVVVDPERHVEGYLDYLAKNGLELR